MKARITYMILIGMPFYITTVLFGSEGLKTNLELVSQIVEEMIEGELPVFEKVPEQTITLQNPVEENPITLYISGQISSALIQRGYRVYMAGDSSESRPVFIWIPEKVSVMYNDPRRPSYFGSVYYTRQVEIRLGIQIFDTNTRRVAWSGSLEAQKSDTISTQDISFIEQGGLILGHPFRSESKGIRNWFEPAAMIGMTGLIVYLFYLIRS